MPPVREWLVLSQTYHDVAAVIGWEKAVELGMAVWERKKPPGRQRQNRTGRGEGGVIYIPALIAEHSGRQLVELVGIDDALRLITAFGGTYLFFPSIERASRPRRDKAIAEQVRSGSRMAAVACAFGLTERQVRRIVQRQSAEHYQEAA
jgi:hypothetical protein